MNDLNPRQAYDAIVLGIGGMGSAACYHLARRGKRVLGLEQFDIPHNMGSSHGVNRIIRLAYYEDPRYVPLLRRAYDLWRELEEGFGERLLFITGSLDAGDQDSEIFNGSFRSCQEHRLPHEVLSSAEIAERYPAYHLPPRHVALFQPDGGFLMSERCIVAHVVAAQAAGAEIRARERVVDWQVVGDRVQVQTDRGDYVAERLVITTGSWIGDLVPDLAALARPERQVVAWFQPTEPALFAPERFPVFNLSVPEGHYYGFPAHNVPGFKLGRYHHRGEQVDADTVDREPNAIDEGLLRTFAERYFPAGAGPTMALRVCLFTNTPDEHFVIDRLPDHSQVVIASACSGHGFKFCSVVGEILADLTLQGETAHDIGIFRLDRFATPATHSGSGG